VAVDLTSLIKDSETVDFSKHSTDLHLFFNESDTLSSILQRIIDRGGDSVFDGFVSNGSWKDRERKFARIDREWLLIKELLTEVSHAQDFLFLLHINFFAKTTNNCYRIVISDDDYDNYLYKGGLFKERLNNDRVLSDTRMICSIEIGKPHRKLLDGEFVSAEEKKCGLLFKEELSELMNLLQCKRIYAWNSLFGVPHTDLEQEPENFYFDMKSDGTCKTVFV